jgi:hypothetical protein
MGASSSSDCERPTALSRDIYLLSLSALVVDYFDRFDSDHAALHHFLQFGQECFNLGCGIAD